MTIVYISLHIDSCTTHKQMVLALDIISYVNIQILFVCLLLLFISSQLKASLTEGDQTVGDAGRRGEGSHKILCSKTWGIGLKKEKNCPGIELWEASEIVCQDWSAGIGVMCNVSRAQTFSCCDADSPRSTVSKIDRSGPEQPPPHSSRQRVLLGKHYTDSFHLVASHTLLFFN